MKWIERLSAMLGKIGIAESANGQKRSFTITQRFQWTGYKKMTQKDTTLTCKRFLFGEKSTISDLYLNGQFQCYVLEDPVRTVKVQGQTAIPYGRYEVVINWSNRFKMELPLFLNVPGFKGVRFHSGNSPDDTEGCPLPGLTYSDDWVRDSRKAFNLVFPQIKKALSEGKVYWEVVKAT